MTLDKELYRQAYQAYQQMNEAEVRYRLHSTDKLSPQEAWRQYVALVEFCWRLVPQQSEWQREQKIAHLIRYYEQLQRLEAWRRAHGKSA